MSEAGAVYQRQFIPGNWKDVTEEEFDLLPDLYPRRIVYLAPQSAQAIETAAIMRCMEVCRQLDDEPRKDQDYASAGDCIDSLLALIPQGGRTQLEEFGMKVAQEVKSATVYNECRNMLTKENELRAIVANRIGEKK